MAALCIASIFHASGFVYSELNKSKSSISPIFPEFEVLSSSADKAEGFAYKVSPNSTLDSSTASLPDFSLRTESLLCDMHP